MDNIFIIAGVIAVIYFIIKFVEMRFLVKEVKPFKVLLRDTLLVYLSVVMGLFIVDQLKVVKKSIDNNSESTNVFTDKPNF